MFVRRNCAFLLSSSQRRKTVRTYAHSPDYITRDEILQQASTLQLAPMMDYTDRHFRHLIRLLSKQTLLYTEMVSANAVAHERHSHQTQYRHEHPHASEATVTQNYNVDYIATRFLTQGTAQEGPSVLQLGGSDPDLLYPAARAVSELSQRSEYHCDYTALNLNCGCPSPKVAGKGCFGAALMDDPALVRDLCQALYEGGQQQYPVTVKCRIGTDSKRSWKDDNDEAQYQELCHFIETVAAGGIVQDFTIHARIAVLTKSFSPADNRKIPPLKYHLIQRLVQDYPHLRFTLNGGIESIPQVQDQLSRMPGLRGVMVGRAFCADPWRFSCADALLYNNDTEVPHRWHVLQQYAQYADAQEQLYDATTIRRFLMKAVTGLFAGEPNSKKYRIALDEIAGLPKKGIHTPISELLLEAATKHLSEETLFRSPLESYEFQTQTQNKDLVREWQADRHATL
ncbi:tRNA-dihydrouridine synthase A [Fistulifera solaris]|uniref:tRNA-dihydrouridine synthase A n=1 Tax=Fistulifera solaris TaxID=1519565 RepID=A0A1Z5K6W2_FISSO|nr:tRNA-dihydrouridine synthase A [Fistulifera solaris]|eukprot:GAX21959.1 tRNA-dihydrouridine synthase A [Fistulifera solaris]